MSNHTQWLTVPTMLTLIRILLTPYIVYAMLQQEWVIAGILFILAGITDVLDGFLARRWRCQTAVGAALDPLADKILLISSFATLTIMGILPRWFFMLMLAKEILLVMGVILLWLCKGSVAMAPTRLAKLATFLQIIFVGMVVFSTYCMGTSLKTYWIMLYFLVILVGIVFCQYAWIGWSYLVRK